MIQKAENVPPGQVVTLGGINPNTSEQPQVAYVPGSMPVVSAQPIVAAPQEQQQQQDVPPKLPGDVKCMVIMCLTAQIIALFFSFLSTIIWAYPPNIYYGMMAVVFTVVPLIASSIIVCCPNGACCCAAPKMFVIMGGIGCAMQVIVFLTACIATNWDNPASCVGYTCWQYDTTCSYCKDIRSNECETEIYTASIKLNEVAYLCTHDSDKDATFTDCRKKWCSEAKDDCDDSGGEDDYFVGFDSMKECNQFWSGSNSITSAMLIILSMMAGIGAYYPAAKTVLRMAPM